jgi:hypothetical protein
MAAAAAGHSHDHHDHSNCNHDHGSHGGDAHKASAATDEIALRQQAADKLTKVKKSSSKTLLYSTQY